MFVYPRCAINMTSVTFMVVLVYWSFRKAYEKTI